MREIFSSSQLTSQLVGGIKKGHILEILTATERITVQTFNTMFFWL